MRYDFEHMDEEAIKEVLQQTDLTFTEKVAATNWLIYLQTGKMPTSRFGPVSIDRKVRMTNFPGLANAHTFLAVICFLAALGAILGCIFYFVGMSNLDSGSALTAFSLACMSISILIFCAVLMPVFTFLRKLGDHIIERDTKK